MIDGFVAFIGQQAGNKVGEGSAPAAFGAADPTAIVDALAAPGAIRQSLRG